MWSHGRTLAIFMMGIVVGGLHFVPLWQRILIGISLGLGIIVLDHYTNFD